MTKTTVCPTLWREICLPLSLLGMRLAFPWHWIEEKLLLIQQGIWSQALDTEFVFAAFYWDDSGCPWAVFASLWEGVSVSSPLAELIWGMSFVAPPLGEDQWIHSSGQRRARMPEVLTLDREVPVCLAHLEPWETLGHVPLTRGESEALGLERFLVSSNIADKSGRFEIWRTVGTRIPHGCTNDYANSWYFWSPGW